MKLKKIVLLLAVVSVAVPVGLYAAHSDSGCASCHTPHHAGDLPGVPLWNGEETTKTFTLYSSATLDAVPGQPDGSSKLCLGCHDGSTFPAGMANPIAGSTLDFGSDLSTSHPISFVYDGALAIADPGLKDPGDPSTLGSTILVDLLDSTSKLQCTSCHDVHSSGIGSSYLRGYDYQIPGDSYSLCRMCHKK